ncbi:MAG TPA: hypothetical protein VF779_13350 [Pyrinomonadaceae bacterium]
MNTGIRRFILRLIVGLLTFIIGVVAAMALGGFRPFSSSPTYIYRNGYSNSMSAEPAFEYHEYRGHGCRMRSAMPPPPPPMVDAPLPPPPPRSSHY